MRRAADRPATPADPLDAFLDRLGRCDDPLIAAWAAAFRSGEAASSQDVQAQAPQSTAVQAESKP